MENKKHHSRTKYISEGETFGYLTVIRQTQPKKYGARYWLCKCKCGNTTTVATGSLTSGNTKSCGCRIRIGARISHTTHGMSYTAEYIVWAGMIGRCTRKSNSNYEYYGGRGIKVCPRWLKFINFIEDMGRRPSNNYTLERIDNSKGYTPSNVRWMDKLKQASNKRNNRILKLNGKSLHLAEWARRLGIPRERIKCRKHKGWTDQEALTLPRMNPWDRKHGRIKC